MELRPRAEGSALVVLADEINLPEPDAFGTQAVIALMRQMVEQGGFWRPGRRRQWVRLRDVRFVGACNPPTDPGRHPLSRRFLRHAPTLLVDFPSPHSLNRIYTALLQPVLLRLPPLAGRLAAVAEAMVAV